MTAVRVLRITFSLAVSLVVGANAAAAGVLVTEWGPAGVVVCNAANDQDVPTVIPDFTGGSYVAWIDRRFNDGGDDMFVSRLGSNGLPVAGWGENGQFGLADGYIPLAVSDSVGGVIVGLWAYSPARAQRLGPNGQVAAGWPANGVAVYDHPWVTSLGPDGFGGAYLAWEDRDPFNYPPPVLMLVQHVTASGAVDAQWPAGGRPVAEGPTNGRHNPVTHADGSGGVFVVWLETDALTSLDVYGTRIRADGSLAPGWPKGGLPLCVAFHDQTSPVVAADGSGGLFVAWIDKRGGATTSSDIYVQRVLATGLIAPGWPGAGVRVSTLPNEKGSLHAHPDGFGGVFLSWARAATGVEPTEQWAIRMTSSGERASGWPEGGLLITSGPFARWFASAANGTEGLVLAWTAFTSQTRQPFAQYVQANGQLPAGANPNGEQLAQVTPTPSGVVGMSIDRVAARTFVAAWRTGGGGGANIGAQRFHLDLPTTAVEPPASGRSRTFLTVSPNPAFATCTVRFELESAEMVEVRLIDALGRVVRRVESAGMESGLHEVPIALAGLSPGLYFATVSSGARTRAVRFAVVKS